MLSKLSRYASIKVISLVIGFVSSFLLAKILGPNDYGVFIVVITVIAFLDLPFGAALQQLSLREFRKKIDAQDGYGYSLYKAWAMKKIFFGLCVSLVVVVAWYFFDEKENGWQYFIIPIVVLLLGYSSLASAEVVSSGRVAQGKSLELIIRPGLFLVMVVMANYASSIELVDFVFLYGVAHLLVALRIGFVARDGAPRIDKPKIYEWDSRNYFKLWLSFVVMALTSVAFTQAPILMMGWLSQPDQVSYYYISSRFAMLVGLPLMVIQAFLSSEITSVVMKNNSDETERLLGKMMRYGVLMSLMVSGVLFSLLDRIVSFFYGADYLGQVNEVVYLLIVSQLVNVTFGPLGTFIAMLGSENMIVKGQFFILLLNVMLLYVSVDSGGAKMAAFISLGLIFLLNLYYMFVLKYSHGVSVLGAYRLR